MFFGGQVHPKIRFRDEIGEAVLHSYEVYNAGPWRVPYLSVVVSWPYQVENGKPVGKWLLYMDETPLVDGHYYYYSIITLHYQLESNSTYKCLVFKKVVNKL